MLGTLVQQLYNAVDVIVVGHFVGTGALAAVGGSASTIIYMLVGFFTGVAGGVTVVISQFYGAKNDEALGKAVHTSIAFSVAGGIIFAILGIFLTPWALRVLKTPDDIMSDSKLYLSIYLGGLIFVFLYNVGSAILRAMGDTKRPLYYLIVCSVINIILDIVLVVIIPLGVAGVAIATVTAQGISAGLTMVALMRQKDASRLEIRKIRIDRSIFNKVVYIGLPGGFQAVMNSLSGMIMAAAVNSLGTYAVAGNTAYAKLDGIYWMVSTAFGVAISTFVGQNYGAGKADRMRKSIGVCVLLDLSISGGLSVIFYFLSKYMLLMFTSDPRVLEQALMVMKAIAPYYMLVVFYDMFGGALRGVGDVMVPMIMNVIGLCVVRAVWILTVSQSYNDIYHIIISCPVSWVITSIMFTVYFAIRFRKAFYIPN